ncbi:LysR family transcriptional regulator [Nocardia aurantia]|uniref:HTH-type transcriptional regulator HdfR n=1 Tax=Nocardia aurantia TaxID=2585199 RepID=A0A7K0DQ39_9NOCA|nr:LysR family transcriptional regulator [Nocardia aurantia]MQY27859.1 HTH-type transcriptional regulator HdfR [Nocardia aurantia]
MELRLLESFLAVAEELHFGRAAARLHMTQPSLSQQLQRLERSLGARLVDRTSHQVGLTPAGVALRDHARLLLAQAEEARAAVHAAAAGRTGTLRVGYNFAAGRSILPAALARMSAVAPGVQVNLAEQRTGPQLTALSAGELDVAFVYGRPAQPQYRHRPMLRVPLVAIVGTDHRWAARTRIPFRELADQPCVLFRREQSPAMYDALFDAAGRSGITLNVAHWQDDSNATAILVSVRPLIGFASALRAGFATAAGGYAPAAALILDDPVPAVELCAVWRADEARPLVHTFLDCLTPGDAGQPIPIPDIATSGNGP